MPDLDVLDTVMHYEQAGEGKPIVLLHGNPTSSYLWRSVIPELTGCGRCLAPDLVGFGQSGKPEMSYRFAAHARYLDAWFDALELDGVTLVGHDWGGALGFDWAARHPDRVRGVAFMETIIKPLTWAEWPPAAREIFQAFRGPAGEELILDRNMFVEVVLPASVARTLTDEEMAHYRRPFPDPASRRPTLAWPREIPIDGEPEDMVERVEAYGRWLSASTDVPKLLLTFEPGAIMTESVLAWCRDNVAALEVQAAGAGIHFVQEDSGPAIGAAVAAWMRRHL